MALFTALYHKHSGIYTGTKNDFDNHVLHVCDLLLNHLQQRLTKLSHLFFPCIFPLVIYREILSVYFICILTLKVVPNGPVRSPEYKYTVVKITLRIMFENQYLEEVNFKRFLLTSKVWCDGDVEGALW